ncbi:hypothetical protein [Psychromonas ingrahamii]|nr:hypothetical protein [Psychromonas ingrahamii]
MPAFPEAVERNNQKKYHPPEPSLFVQKDWRKPRNSEKYQWLLELK